MAVSPEEFVKIWQTSKSLDEVAKKTKIPRINCGQRASYYRLRKNIPLKKFPNGGGYNRMDNDKLIKLALQYAPNSKE